MKFNRSYTLSYQQMRYIFSLTGVWKKKITKTALVDIEKQWKAAVLSPTSTNVEKLVKDGRVKKKYILSMFPYPSGELHMGHMRVYTVSDVLARYHRLNGHQVLHPIGWDAFGLPAENAAIDRKIPPRKWTESNIARMRRQLHDLRISFDWDREITTCNADYYKWTQLLFLRMYAKGLAYSMTASVNWDPVDQTVLADEQIDENGCSWRSGAKATKKYLTQWYLRSTNYTQSLLDGLNSLDPDSCRGFANAQRAWLKEPTGVRINVRIEPGNEVVSVFTEHPHLIYGVDFLQLASDHPLISRISEANNLEPGLLNEVVMIHPLTGERIPIVVKDSGPLMSEVNRCRFGVSTLYSEDESTANLYSISPKPKVLTSQGRLQHSHRFDGMSCEEARQAVCTHLQRQNLGGWPTSSELRDWLISRQRYWGTPIPIIHCSSCGVVPVPEGELPVMLPEVDGVDLKGGNPLKSQQEWINTSCPKCGKAATREADTMDTFVDSAWYYLRFTDPHNNLEPFSKEAAQLMPVDVYVGGAEHAILHMYYARFINHFLYDEGLTDSREPFSLQLALGTVHSDCYKLTATGRYLHRGKVVRKGEDFVEKKTGEPVTHTLEKMSKSKLNGVSPADVLSVHGVDQTRLYMLANAAPRAVKNWDADLAKKLLFPHGKQLSIPRWMHVMWHTVAIIRERRLQMSADDLTAKQLDSKVADMLFEARNDIVSSVSQHLSHTFNLHEAIHCLYDNMNTIDKEAPLEAKIQSYEFERCFADMIILLHPFAPHVTAELWEGLRTAPRLVTERPSHDWASDIFNQRWPTVDDEYPVEFVVQHSSDLSIDQSEADIADVSQSEETESETGQSDAQKGYRPSSQWINLPAKVFSSLTTSQAIQLALAHNLIVPKDGVNPSAIDCKLVLRHNSGAILTVDDNVSIVHWRGHLTSKQDVTS